MAKKNLKNEIRHKDEDVEEIKTTKVEEKKPRKKMTANDKRKLVLKIVGWMMAISMVLGTLLALFAPLMYK